MPWVNNDTGEMIYLAFPKRKKFKNEGKERHMKVFDVGLEYLNELNLTGVDYKIVFKLLQIMEYKNWIHINQHLIAEELGINQPQIAKSLKKLVSYGVLHKHQDANDRRKNVYQFNEEIAIRGSKNDWDNMQKTSNEESLYTKFRKTKIQNQLQETIKKYDIKDGVVLNLLETIVTQAIANILEESEEESDVEEIEINELEIEGEMPLEGFNNGDEIELTLPAIELKRNGKKCKFKATTYKLKFKQYTEEVEEELI